MRLLFLSLAFFGLFMPSAISQDVKFRLGKVPDEDLAMTVYPQDSSADAVVLADYAEYRFENLYDLKIRRMIRIKILTTDGLDYGTYPIPVIGDLKVYTKGFTVNPGGSTKIRNEHRNIEYLEDDKKQTTITFPDVRVGSVLDLEYSYTIPNSGGVPIYKYAFQREIPVREQELNVFTPEYLVFNFRQQGHSSVYMEEAGTTPSNMRMSNGGSRTFLTTHRRFKAKNTPAFIDESYAGAASNYYPSLTMEIDMIAYQGVTYQRFANSWTSLELALMDDNYFGDFLKGNTSTSTIAYSLTMGASDLEKAQILADYLKQNYQWNDYLGETADNKISKVLSEKKGNVGSLNLLYIALLRQAGVIAYPVLASTRAHGRINELIAMQSDINYVLAYVQVEENKGLLLDVTNPNLPFTMLPFRVMNGRGRLLDGRGGKWVPIMNEHTLHSASKGKAILHTDGSISGEIEQEYRGYAALDLRDDIKAEGETARQTEIAESLTEWEVEDYAYSDAMDTEGTVNESWKGNSYDLAIATGDRLYLNPLLGLGIKKSLFDEEERTLPVDLGVPLSKDLRIQIEIPEGFELEEMPENKAVTLPNEGGTYRVTYTINGNLITVINKVSLNKAYFTTEEYPLLREFYSLVIAENDAQIVLKKTTSE